MRLTCPNCGAVYEVPEEVIPDAGRDVQCSNCGDTWFQAHPDHPAPEGAGYPDEDRASEMEEIGISADEVSDATPDDRTDDHDDSGDGTSDDRASDGAIADDDAGPEPEETRDDTTGGPAPRRGLDPGIAEVLRQEATREQRAREAEAATGLETQDELGLSEPTDERDRRTREAAERMAHLRGNPATGARTTPEDDSDEADYVYEGFDSADETEDEHDIDPASRRNLLPDIEEISSSLNSGEPRQRAAATVDVDTQDEAQSSGFMRGFSISIMIFAVLWALYIFAPALSRSIPALTPALETYTGLADMARTWVESLGRALLRLADNLAGPALKP